MYNNLFILISITFIMLLVGVFLLNKTSTFETMLDKEKDSSETMIKFCEKLHQLDDNENAGVYTNEYYNNIYKNNETQIKLLKETIQNLNEEIVSIDVESINNFRLKTDEEAKEQLELIEKTLDNIKNKNNIKLTLN